MRDVCFQSKTWHQFRPAGDLVLCWEENGDAALRAPARSDGRRRGKDCGGWEGCLPDCDVGLAPVSLLEQDDSAGFYPSADESTLGSSLVGVRGNEPPEVPVGKPGFRPIGSRNGVDEVQYGVLTHQRGPSGCRR